MSMDLDTITKITSASLAGCVLTAAGVGLVEYFKDIKTRSTVVLDPNSPNIQDLDIPLTEVYRRCIGTFYRLCPTKTQEKYRLHVQNSIRMSDLLLGIERGLIDRTIEANPQLTTHGYNIALQSMYSMRQARLQFTNETMQMFTKQVDSVAIALGEHLCNIRLLLEKN